MNEVIIAPPGWGWPPRFPLLQSFGPAEEALPEMELLDVLRPLQRNEVIFETLRDFPRVREIRPVHLVRKYAMPMTSARKMIDRLRRRRA